MTGLDVKASRTVSSLYSRSVCVACTNTIDTEVVDNWTINLVKDCSNVLSPGTATDVELVFTAGAASVAAEPSSSFTTWDAFF